ncbi:hypothetical protein LJB89_03785 [Tyzzerella sp. OttesenSCG-928-J15]|nr:hypothetical protein [Tyzzerella sp. OttesenSCG-928-J15]
MKTLSLENIIEQHLHKYSHTEFQDMVKLFYQNEFGGGHLIDNPQSAYLRLFDEMETATPNNDVLEYIGNDICRIYLGGFAKKFSSNERAARVLNAMFVQSSAIKQGSISSYKIKLNTLLNMVESGRLSNFSPSWANNYAHCLDYVEKHIEAGCPMLRHSEEYREHYNPAYRIINQEFYRYMPLFAEIENKLENRRLILAIDGKCGSGKTTLAEIISSVYNCPVINMDDFFLPKNLRSAERLAEAGGNLHYERFMEEVIQPVKSGARAISYKVFDCSVMDYKKEARIVDTSGLVVVEGSYCMRPEFREIYDYMVFLDIDGAKQKERIIARNGIEGFKMFEEKWIPMENKYFNHFNIADCCNNVYK